MNRPTRYLATATPAAPAFGACTTSASAATTTSQALPMSQADLESHAFEVGIDNARQEYPRLVGAGMAGYRAVRRYWYAIAAASDCLLMAQIPRMA